MVFTSKILGVHALGDSAFSPVMGSTDSRSFADSKVEKTMPPSPAFLAQEYRRARALEQQGHTSQASAIYERLLAQGSCTEIRRRASRRLEILSGQSDGVDRLEDLGRRLATEVSRPGAWLGMAAAPVARSLGRSAALHILSKVPLVFRQGLGAMGARLWGYTGGFFSEVTGFSLVQQWSDNLFRQDTDFNSHAGIEAWMGAAWMLGGMQFATHGGHILRRGLHGFNRAGQAMRLQSWVGLTGRVVPELSSVGGGWLGYQLSSYSSGRGFVEGGEAWAEALAMHVQGKIVGQILAPQWGRLRTLERGLSFLHSELLLEGLRKTFLSGQVWGGRLGGVRAELGLLTSRVAQAASAEWGAYGAEVLTRLIQGAAVGSSLVYALAKSVQLRDKLLQGRKQRSIFEQHQSERLQPPEARHSWDLSFSPELQAAARRFLGYPSRRNKLKLFRVAKEYLKSLGVESQICILNQEQRLVIVPPRSLGSKPREVHWLNRLAYRLHSKKGFVGFDVGDLFKNHASAEFVGESYGIFAAWNDLGALRAGHATRHELRHFHNRDQKVVFRLVAEKSLASNESVEKQIRTYLGPTGHALDEWNAWALGFRSRYQATLRLLDQAERLALTEGPIQRAHRRQDLDQMSSDVLLNLASAITLIDYARPWLRQFRVALGEGRVQVDITRGRDGARIFTIEGAELKDYQYGVRSRKQAVFLEPQNPQHLTELGQYISRLSAEMDAGRRFLADFYPRIQALEARIEALP